ncbi:MAG: PAS domain-containing protein, partial [Cyclobacteriaceae bacterium]|nr:PAS domain-containing protein [Cyclobacteriaceae bacterium]
SEKVLKEAQTIAKVGYWDLDLVNNRLYWSEEIYRLLGLAPFSMDATFETFVEFVHPEDREWVTNAYLTHVSDKVEYDIIHRMLLKDGSIRYVNEKCETNYTEDGVPLRSLGIVIDITEQKKSEIELQKYKEQLENLVEQRTSELQKANERLYSINKELSIKEERYRLLAENVTEVIANFENSGKINYLSPSINNLLGYRTNELIGKNFIDFVENDFKLKFTVRLKVMKGKDSYLECPLIKKNGEKIWVGISLNSIKTEKNNVSFEYISVIRDITEIKKVQQSIVTSEENLREAQQLAKLGTWSLDILSNRMFWSEVQYSIYEVSRKEAPENFNEYLLFVHPDDMESIKQGYESIGKSKYIFESEYRIITKKGNMKYIFSRMEPVYQKGKLCSIKGINYDITRRKEAELELKKALDELNLNHSKLKQTQSQLLISEKMASLGTLTAGIAHEINNPMTFIHGGITALKESLGEIIPILKIVENIDENRFEETFHKLKTIKDEAHFPKRLGMLNKMVANIESGVDRTLEIVKGLQVFTRSREDEIISVDMHENLEATLIILRNSYKDIAHITKMFDTIPPIECNPGKINQVITNIIVNAIHALEEKFDEKNKGHIIIKTGFEQVNGIDSIGICIGNNGDRIPEKIRKKIFEPFFTTKPVGKGTGLGLSLSYTIVNGHKGTIKIVEEEHSIEGNNHIFTVFKITLPIVHV